MGVTLFINRQTSIAYVAVGSREEVVNGPLITMMTPVSDKIGDVQEYRFDDATFDNEWLIFETDGPEIFDGVSEFDFSNPEVVEALGIIFELQEQLNGLLEKLKKLK